MATVKIDDKAFQAGLHAALADFDHQAETTVRDLGEQIAELARGFAPQGETGAIEAGIGIEAGRTEKGPFCTVGVLSPPDDRHDFYQEFGTFKMRAHPYMRPALAAVGAAVKTAGFGAHLRGSKRVAALRRRGAARRKLRLATQRGKITSVQARSASRVISSLKGRRLRLRSLKVG